MIDFSTFKKLTIGGVELKQLFINGIQVWKAGYKNWVPYSTTEDGKTIYNGGLGYKNGYRMSSSGAEKTQTGSALTGFIPAKFGDVIRMGNAHWGSAGASDGYSYIAYYDANFKLKLTINKHENSSSNGHISNVGSSYKELVDRGASNILTDSKGVTTFNIVFTSPVSYSYIRINATADGADMIVTVNEEIE